MRKPSKRWIALAGATTVSVAGLTVPTGASATDDEPLPWPVVQQNTSSYTLEGFAIEYLPPGLEEHRLSAKSATNDRGGRSSDITWSEGPDEVYGKIEVIRDGDITSLDKLREARYGHLDTGRLEEVDNDERRAYLSEGTGDLFWVEEPGLAVTAYLQPDGWGPDELARMATSSRKQPETGPPDTWVRSTQEPEGEGYRPPQDGVFAPSEHERPAPPGGDAPTPPAWATPENEPPETEPLRNTADRVPTGQELSRDASGEEIRECLAEQVAGAPPRSADEADPDAGSIAQDEARFAGLWHAAEETTRENAVRECTGRFGVAPSVVQEVVEAAEGAIDAPGVGSEDHTVEAALTWTLPSAPVNR